MKHSPRLVLILLGTWFAIALGVGGAGLLVDLRPPWPQAIVLSLTLLSLVSLFRAGPIQAWALHVDPRHLVAFHLTRLIGFYFLVLYARGELPYEFAVVGGWGDIVVAITALALILAGPMTGKRRNVYLAWNLVGLADMIFVVGTATRLGLTDPASLAPLLRLPLSLLITFVVPIVLATHIWLFRRIAHAEPAGLRGTSDRPQ